MKKNVLLSVIGVLLVLGIGVSFAYFVSQTLVSGDGASVTAEPGDMIKVTYDAGDAPLSGNNLMPGDSTSKDFTVTVTPTETEKEATYAIFLNITENTFVKCDDTNYNDLTNMCTKDAQELTYTIKDKDSGSTLASGDLTGVTGKVKLLTETKTVETETTFNYTITITFVDTGADQNHNQNKTFNGDVGVEFTTTAKDVILANYSTVKTRTFPLTASSKVEGNTTGVIYKSADSNQYDNDGEVYYFAGNPTDNWVKWAGFYWRIIRINGNGSIRMIYQGTSANTTGTGTQLQTSTFNDDYNRSEYVGLKYTKGEQHGQNSNSTIMGVLNTWYSENIEKTDYVNDIDTNVGFCSDRNMGSGYSWSSQPSSTIYYAAYDRVAKTSSNVNPSFKCSNTSDILKIPVGLITVDETVYAGLAWNANNSSNYLYTNQNYWTMSPCWFRSGNAYVFAVGLNGQLSSGYVDWTVPGVRPVVNLKSSVQITGGNGSSGSPYVIG